MPTQECSSGDITIGNMLNTFHYRSQQMSNEMADKLDVMMLVMYEYLNRITHNVDGQLTVIQPSYFIQ